MAIPNVNSIADVKVTDILRKEPFKRTLPDEPGDSLHYFYVTQDDFLREFDPHSHSINSIKYFPNLLYLDKEQKRKYQAKIRSRVSVAWQKRIHTKRLLALTGYDPNITIAKSKTDDKSQKDLADFKEGWGVKSMDVAVHLAISSDLKVGDTAFCGFKSGGVFGYRLFAYDKGDILYPHYDPMTGRLNVFGRKFHVSELMDSGLYEDVCYLDVWTDSDYMQYRAATSEELARDARKPWIVTVEPKPHGFRRIPIAYHRYGEPCWAGSQSLIDQNELSLSQLAENNAQYALRILYTLGADFEMEGSTDGTPRRIDGTDPNSKVGFLEPADSSNSFELELKTQEREIMRCSFAVESPEIKSGSDISSLTVKALMADSYLKALEDSKEYQGFLNDIVEIFIDGYGTEVRMLPDFDALKVQIRLQPWTFQSEQEVVNTLVQLVINGIISRRSATECAYEMLGLGAVDELDRVLQEKHDELLGGQSTTDTGVNVVNNARALAASV